MNDITQNLTADVSVIVLTLNSERFISRCLTSLVTQHFKNFDVIVVDAGSSDNTEYLVQGFRDRLKLKFVTAPDTNMAEARNIGIRTSNSKFIAFCDSDDLFKPDKLSRALELMQGKCSNGRVVFSNCIQFDEDNPLTKYIPREIGDFLRDRPYNIIVEQGINLSSLLVERVAASDVLFAENEGGRFGEDWQYIINLAVSNYEFLYLPGAYSEVSVRQDSHTSWSVQAKLKWYVLCHIITNKQNIIGLGCPPLFWKLQLSKHWIKFLLATVASGDFGYPIAGDSVGVKIPLVVRFLLQIFSRLNSTFFRNIIIRVWLRRRFSRSAIIKH